MAIVINVQGNTNDLIGKLYGAGQATKNLEKDIQASGNKLRGMFFQLNFAAQDFSQVFMQGGANAFGRAMMGAANNLGMLGAQFGFVAMAASTAASIGLNIWSQSLEKAEKEAKALEERNENLRKSFDELQKSALKFQQNIRGKDSKELLGMGKSLQDELDLLQIDIKSKQDEVVGKTAQFIQNIESRGGTARVGKKPGETSGQFDWTWSNFGLSGREEAPSDLLKAEDELQSLRQRSAQLRSQILESERRSREQQKKEAGEAHLNAMKRIQDEELELKKKMELQAEEVKLRSDPKLKYKKELGPLAEMYGKGLISDAQFTKERKRLEKEFLSDSEIKLASTRPGVSATDRGSREYLESLLRARQPPEDKSFKNSALAKLTSINEEARKMVNELRRQKSGGGNKLAVAQF